MSITLDYQFSDVEKNHLTQNFLKIDINPYTNYDEFSEAVNGVIKSGDVPDPFLRLCETKRQGDQYKDPYFLMKNCPIDPELPYLDYEDAVNDKRKRKTTYVAEVFLLLYAKLMQQEPIGYINVNDGDVFQDIHPLKKLATTQSQKAEVPIFFHKDLANHYVRPDWVNILGLRSNPENKIYTSFVSNRELLAYLPENIKDALRKNEYHTPYDDLTTASGNKEMGEAPPHPILGGAEAWDIRFFENRTKGLNEDAQNIVGMLIEALHKLKKPLHILAGDFIGSANNETIHNKEIIEIKHPQDVYNRWLMKTVNVKSLEPYQHHMLSGKKRIVNG